MAIAAFSVYYLNIEPPKQTATFLTANSPACVSHVYRFVSRQNYDGSEAGTLLPLNERLSRAAIMREVGLKCAVFVGVPRVSVFIMSHDGDWAFDHMGLD